MRMKFASLFVSDEDKAIDFYTNKLGVTLLMDNPTPFGGRFIMFAAPQGGATLVVSKPIPGRPAQIGGPGAACRPCLPTRTATSCSFTRQSGNGCEMRKRPRTVRVALDSSPRCTCGRLQCPRDRSAAR